jgi:hypothetical protein
MAFQGSDPYTTEIPRNEPPTTAKTYTSTQLWLWGFCCCIVVFLVIVGIVSLFYWNSFDHFHQWAVDKVNALSVAQAESAVNHPAGYGNVVSLSALKPGVSSRVKPFVLSALRLFQTSGDNPSSAPLLPLDNELVADEAQAHYSVFVEVTLAYDVDVSRLALNAQRLDQSQRYMRIAYVISSTYADFSTVKLIETTLNRESNSLQRTKEIVLCSNNVLYDSQACSLKAATSLFVKNTGLMIMSHRQQDEEQEDEQEVPETPTRKPPTRTNTTGGPARPPARPGAPTGGGAMKSDQLYFVEGGSQSQRPLALEEDFTRDISFYSVVFYRPTTGGNGGRKPMVETAVLTVRPQ